MPWIFSINLFHAANSLRPSRIPTRMNTKLTMPAILTGILLAFAPLSAWSRPAQQSNSNTTAKQDMKDAGHDSKNAAKDAGRGVKKGTKKTYHATKRGTQKAWNKTRNTTKGAVKGGKAGAKQPDESPK